MSDKMIKKEPGRGNSKSSGSKTSAGSRGGRGRGREKRGYREQQEREFDQKIVDLSRVTRVMAGGKRMRFRACVVIGDHKGRVGVGVGKGVDVSLAITKAVADAKKQLIHIFIFEETLPHAVFLKLGAAKVLLKPAPKGTGIIAGGAVRTVLDLGGVPNVAAKMLGSRNPINNARATVHALSGLSQREANKKEPFKKTELTS